MLKKQQEYMVSLILNCLNEHNLPIENLRRQSYNGASNMSGTYKGVKTLLQKQQPLTYYRGNSPITDPLLTPLVSQ